MSEYKEDSKGRVWRSFDDCMEGGQGASGECRSLFPLDK